MPKGKDETPEAYFTVLHAAVGPFYAGQVVTAKQFGVDADGNATVDLQRLLDLGAIAPVDSAEAIALIKSLGPDAVTPLGDKVFGSTNGAETVVTPPDTANTKAPF